MVYKSIAVFCGSKSGSNPLFEQHASELGTMLGEHNTTLIYGGGRKGLMGAVADGVMGKGGKVMGVIPEILIGWEQQHLGITNLQIVADMHSRKKIIYDMCDAAIILPGGFGTLDELFEILTWNTLKIHDKKIILLNTAGFYDNMIAHVNTMEQSGFLYEKWTDRIEVCGSPQAIFDSLGVDKR
jgi:uncharacterized protein (TIGR00730 family)